jgi:hypothetical protein
MSHRSRREDEIMAPVFRRGLWLLLFLFVVLAAAWAGI